MAEENKAIEWPGGANVADDFDFLMVGKNGQPIMKIPKEKLNEVIVINGEGIKAVAGGASSETPTILAPGPAGQNRKMEDVTGWFVNGTGNPLVAVGEPWEAPAGFKNTNWWDGTTWSLGSSVPLPTVDTSDLATKEEVAVKVGSRRFGGKNKFDKAKVLPGYMSINGNVLASETLVYGEPIYVELGTYRARSGNTSTGLRYLAAFNSAGVAIPTAGITTATSTFVISDPEVAYVVPSVPITALEDFQIEKGEIATPYEPYVELKLLEEDSRLNTSQLNVDKKLGADVLDFTKATDNAFDKNATDVKLGYFINQSNGVATANPDYNATGFITIPYGATKITTSFRHQNAFYNGTHARIAGNAGSPLAGKFTYDIPANAEFYRQGIAVGYWDEAMISFGEDLPDTYVPYGYEIDKDKILVPQPDVSRITNSIDTVTGNNASIVSIATLADGEVLNDTVFPYFIKKNIALSVALNLTSLIGYIRFGKGRNSYRGCYIDITPTQLLIKYKPNDNTEVVLKTDTHGITIGTFLRAVFFEDESGILRITISSIGGTFSTTYEHNNEVNFATFVETVGQEVTNVKMTSGTQEFQRPIWVIGDSYLGIAANRWPGVLKKMGFFNILINGLAGQKSAAGITDLNRMLSFGVPKYIVWAMGMNDTNSEHGVGYNSIVEICDKNEIELILTTVPSIPSKSRTYISNNVRNSGYRYIDFAKAVGADNETGVWYPGYIDTDNVHPSEIGAKALATQALADFPEIMQYGYAVYAGATGGIEGDK